MAVRFSCEQKYDDRWCRWHGACSCIGLSDSGGRAWVAHGDNPDCLLHGHDTSHPLAWAKVVRGGRAQKDPQKEPSARAAHRRSIRWHPSAGVRQRVDEEE